MKTTVRALLPLPSDGGEHEELQAALLRIEAIMKNAPMGIIFTVERRITAANAEFNRMFGYKEGEAIGMAALALYPDQDAYDALGQIAAPRLSKALPVDVELRMRRNDASLFWAQLVGYVVDPQQASRGTIWLILDRTEARAQADALQRALQENQAVLDSAALGIVVLRNRQIQRCNPQLEAMFGYPPGSMVGISTREWYPSDQDYDWVGRHLYAQLQGGRSITHDLPLKRRDGSIFWARMSGRDLGGKSPMGDATLWMLDDISEQRHTEDALRAATTLNQAVFDGANVCIIATDSQGLVQLFNAAAQRLLGYSASEILYRHSPALLHLPEEVEAYAAELTAEIGTPVAPGFDVFCIRARLAGMDEREWTYRCKDGRRVPVSLSVTVLRDERGQITGYLGIATDITERRRAQALISQSQAELESRVQLRTQELAHSNARLLAEVAERTAIERQMRELAHYDPITGLPNRNLLHDRITQALLHAKRNGEMVAVMFLDLDRFKNINDTLGHSVGDALLRQVGACLSATLRGTDTLARLGGDEFLLVIPQLASLNQAVAIAEKLMAALQAPLVVDEHAIHVTTSIGICVAPQDGDSMDLLLRNADTAMYQAKSGGRNTMRFFTEQMNLQANQHYRIESALRVGVRGGELQLMYQPLVDTAKRRVFGVEALVRWHSSALGATVPPGQFIGIAEETSLIEEIDSWVLREALAQAARWRAQGHTELTMAVNLSARQFRRKDIVSFVAEVLAETGYPPHLLELEITESSLMHNVNEVIDTLEQLVRLGVRLAIDDFGTGYSSLAYLKRFPVHKLKVDQSFVRDIGEKDSDLAIAKAVITLAQTLGIEVLAEGVETPAQLAQLQALGCDRFQGYWFARPLSAAGASLFLAAPFPHGGE